MKEIDKKKIAEKYGVQVRDCNCEHCENHNLFMYAMYWCSKWHFPSYEEDVCSMFTPKGEIKR